MYAAYHGTALESSKAGLEYHLLDVLQQDVSLDYLPGKLDGWVYCPGTINHKLFLYQ